jgi:hypothetical protein
MDDMTYDILVKMNLPKIKLTTLKDFESPELLEVKVGRTIAEYSWTCASNFLWFLLQKNKEFEVIIYLDADLYFFSDPKVLIEELGNKDILITEHRYSQEYQQSVIVSGKYCVQFMIFKNNSNGLAALDWWRQACINWCFGYLDKGRFGDQKYLDNWTTCFEGVHELQNLGGGVAPWNVQQYKFSAINGKIFGHTQKTKESWPLIFYHFHNFRLISPQRYFPVLGYYIPKGTQSIIYEPYFKALQNTERFTKSFAPDFGFGYRSVSTKDRLNYWITRFNFTKPIIKFYKLIKK